MTNGTLEESRVRWDNFLRMKKDYLVLNPNL